jgi:hypothetical protein
MATAAHPTPPGPLAEEKTEGGKGGKCAPAADPACPPLVYDWSQATRSDLRLLACAIRRRWPIRGELCRSFVEAVTAIVTDPASPPALRIAAARVLLEMDKDNMRLEAGG